MKESLLVLAISAGVVLGGLALGRCLNDFDPDENRRLVHSAAHRWAAEMNAVIVGLSCQIYAAGGKCDAQLGDGRIVLLDCTLETCRMRRVVE